MIVLHAILVAGAASALVLGPLQGQAPLPTLYPIDQAHSQIGFSVRFMGLSRVRGTLANFSGSIMYDGRAMPSGSFSWRWRRRPTIPTCSIVWARDTWPREIAPGPCR